MGRWQPDARGRLQQAAFELIGEQGYDGTTVAGIAERAGLTERTFFRYFADKREVLFSGQDVFTALVLDALADAPAGTVPFDAVVTGLTATAAFFGERRPFARMRQDLIDSHSELQERELMKMAGLGERMAAALRDRGVSGAEATLAAAAGVAAFRVAFAGWVAGDDHDLGWYIRSAVDDLRAVTAQGSHRPGPP